MTDREAVGVRLLKMFNEWNADGHAFIDGLPDISLLALRDALGNAAIACMQERWTSEAAIRRAAVAMAEWRSQDGNSMLILDALTAAMRDDE